MNTTDEIRKISCYAVLQSGYAGENYLLPHMRLVLSLVCKKAYQKLDANTLVSDFFDEYKYCIDFFPMQQILGVAVENGYLRKCHNRKIFTPTEKINEFHDIFSDISNSEITLQRFIIDFQSFAKKCGVDYSSDNASNIVIAYVNSQKLEHISGHIEGIVDDSRVDYVFGKYVYWIRENNKELFDFLSRLVTGSILADCLTFHEVLRNGRQLDGLTVIFDSSLVFMTLGVDVIDRSVYYKALIQSLIDKGAKVAMYSHSYDEMMRVIIGASSWVESYAYDPALASITTEYFRSIRATKSDVEEYSLTLKSKIADAQIEIMNVDYIPANYKHQQDEEKIYSMIVENYRRTNPSFNEDAQRYSIELDARSIAHVYLLRKTLRPRLIPDANYLFITANRSLSKVANDYNITVFGNPDTIPAVLTDVFLGTFIWLSDPVKTMQMNEQQITAHAYLAFQPNTILVQKLSTTVRRLLEHGKIDADTCYTLMSNKMVMDKLAKRTLGDPSAYTEDTPMDILAEIKSDGRQEGFEEATKLHMEAQNELAQSIAIVQKRHMEEKDALNHQIASILADSLSQKVRLRDDLLLRKAQADNYRKGLKRFIFIIAVSSATIALVGVVWFWIIDKGGQANILPLITALAPLSLWIVGFICNVFLTKIINPNEVLNIYISQKYQRKCKELRFSEFELATLSDEIDQNQAQIEEHLKSEDDSTQAAASA